MILTDCYMFIKLPEIEAKYRYDLTKSTMSYDLFETLLINKRKPRKGGFSFNFVPRPEHFGGHNQPDNAITKGSINISSVYIPIPEEPVAFGDVKNTKDACLFLFNNDFISNGIKTIDIFIARGQKHNKRSIYLLYLDGELDDEIIYLKASLEELL